MDFKKLIVTAWQNTVNHIGPVLLVTFVQMVLIIVSLGFLAPVTTAGYVQSLLRTHREQKPPEVGDLFSYMRLFIPLTLFYAGVLIFVVLGFSFLVLPGFVVAGFVAFATFYLIPLMTDKDFKMMAALKKSWEIATESPINDHLIIAIIYIAIISLGGSLPFAFLITQPLATFILVGAYQERVAAIQTNRPPASPPPPPPGSSRAQDTPDNHQ